MTSRLFILFNKQSLQSGWGNLALFMFSYKQSIHLDADSASPISILFSHT